MKHENDRGDEILLNRCRAAETLEEQKKCFDDLAEFLETIETRNHNDRIDDDEKSTSVRALAARENISRSLLTTWPYVQVSACVDRVLDACGPMISISTCSSLLKEIAVADSKNRCESQDSSLSTSWTPYTSSLPLRSIVQACWATIQRTLLTATPPLSLTSSETGIIYDEDDERRRLEMQQFISKIVLLLPQALANACFAVKLQLPLHGTPTYFFPRLIYFAWMQMQSRAQTKSMASTKDSNFSISRDRDESILYTKVLIIHLLQTRRSEHVVHGLMQRFGENSNNGSLFGDEDVGDGGENSKIADQESASLSSFLISLKLRARDMASFILALLQYANTPESSNSLLLPTVKYLWFRSTACGALLVCNLMFHSLSVEHQEIITEHLIFSNKASSSSFHNNDDIKEKDQRRWSRCVVETISPSPVPSNRIDDTSSLTSFSKRLVDIADRWSQLTFVQDVGGRLQHHVTLVLWYGLIIIERSQLSLQNPGQRILTGALVNGVSHRLGSILPTIRQDGMRIAQQLAKGLGQDGVRFDEFVDDDSDCDEDRQYVSSGDGSNNVDHETIEIIETAGKSHSKHEKHTFLDPDADYDSDMEEEVDGLSDTNYDRPRASTNESFNNNNIDDSESDDVSVEWKDELLPYDLEDDEEDLRTTPKPLHLLEALDLLRTGDNHDYAFTRHEAALEALPSLIRNRPDDLVDVAVSLVLELLRMEDKFNIEDFNTKRESAIRTLLVEESLSVGQTLIEQLFEESGLADKLLILASLQSSALELSGNKVLLEATTNPEKKGLLNGQHNDNKSLQYPPYQLSLIQSKTRRKRSRSHRKAIKNNFSNTSPVWFYSLIAGFMNHRNDEALWTGSTGSILLAYFFRCLATIVEFSGAQASQILANDLLDLVWDFRTADVPEVRLSALVAVSTSIAMLSNDKLISLLFDKDNLSKTMLEMSRRDPDKECRSLCQTISLSIHEVLDNNNI